jgi:hypothetical protein
MSWADVELKTPDPKFSIQDQHTAVEEVTTIFYSTFTFVEVFFGSQWNIRF